MLCFTQLGYRDVVVTGWDKVERQGSTRLSNAEINLLLFFFVRSTFKASLSQLPACSSVNLEHAGAAATPSGGCCVAWLSTSNSNILMQFGRCTRPNTDFLKTSYLHVFLHSRISRGTTGHSVPVAVITMSAMNTMCSSSAMVAATARRRLCLELCPLAGGAAGAPLSVRVCVCVCCVLSRWSNLPARHAGHGQQRDVHRPRRRACTARPWRSRSWTARAACFILTNVAS